MPFVQATGGTALQDVQPDRHTLGIGAGQESGQDGRADASALHFRCEVEVLQPTAVLGRPQGDAARDGSPASTTEVCSGT